METADHAASLRPSATPELLFVGSRVHLILRSNSATGLPSAPGHLAGFTRAGFPSEHRRYMASDRKLQEVCQA